MERTAGVVGSGMLAFSACFFGTFVFGQGPVPVVAARASTMQTASGQPFVGTVLPARTSDVGSAVDGRLVELPIVDGQHVEENQPIAQLLRGLLEIERAGA